MCSPTEAEESQRDGKQGVGGGHRSPPLLIRQRRFMWTATSCRANERTAPSTSAPSPLYSPLYFFFFYFPSQSRGRSDVDKAECGPLRAFLLLLLFRVFLYIFFFFVLLFFCAMKYILSGYITYKYSESIDSQPTTLCINVTHVKGRDMTQ